MIAAPHICEGAAIQALLKAAAENDDQAFRQAGDSVSDLSLLRLAAAEDSAGVLLEMHAGEVVNALARLGSACANDR